MKTCAWTDCSNQFTPRFRTTERYCSSQCAWNAKKKQQEQKKQSQRQQKPISNRSKKRAKMERIYSAKRIVFLSKEENKKCAVYPNEPATEIHHKKGRIGLLLIDERYWLAVSRKGHKYIEEHPEEAKLKGWSLSRLAKDNGEESQQIRVTS